MLERLTQRSSVCLLAAIVLQVASRYGLQVDVELYQTTVDVISFILFGFYVYHTEAKSLL